ncbi:MAG: hypothetical protein V1767_03555 [Chloroflexota bacterium]
MKTEILSKALVVAAEAKHFPIGKPITGILRVATPSTNAAAVYITGGDKAGYAIAAGQSQELRVGDLSLLFYIGTASDILYIFAEIPEREVKVGTGIAPPRRI